MCLRFPRSGECSETLGAWDLLVCMGWTRPMSISSAAHVVSLHCLQLQKLTFGGYPSDGVP
eukprot:1905977-Amphidinium_carterae.2